MKETQIFNELQQISQTTIITKMKNDLFAEKIIDTLSVFDYSKTSETEIAYIVNIVEMRDVIAINKTLQSINVFNMFLICF